MFSPSRVGLAEVSWEETLRDFSGDGPDRGRGGWGAGLVLINVSASVRPAGKDALTTKRLIVYRRCVREVGQGGAGGDRGQLLKLQVLLISLTVHGSVLRYASQVSVHDESLLLSHLRQ